MFLQLVRVVVARQIEIFEPGDHAVVHDANNIRLFHVLWHATDRRAVLRLGRATVAFPVAFDHLREVKIDLVTSAILHQGNAIAVADFASDRGDAHGRCRTALDPRGPFLAARHLHPPEAREESSQTEEHAEPEELDPPNRLSATQIHRILPVLDYTDCSSGGKASATTRKQAAPSTWRGDRA